MGRNASQLLSCLVWGRCWWAAGLGLSEDVFLLPGKRFLQDLCVALRRRVGGFKNTKKTRNYHVGPIAVNPDFVLNSGTSQLR